MSLLPWLKHLPPGAAEVVETKVPGRLRITFRCARGHRVGRVYVTKAQLARWPDFARLYIDVQVATNRNGGQCFTCWRHQRDSEARSLVQAASKRPKPKR